MDTRLPDDVRLMLADPALPEDLRAEVAAASTRLLSEGFPVETVSRAAFCIVAAATSPATLDDAVAWLHAHVPFDKAVTFAAQTEKEFIASQHFEIGMRLRENWNLWSDTSRLHRHLR